MNFTPEQDQYLQLAQSRAYYRGLRDGVSKFSHWKDGTQYVGTTGRTLREVLATIDMEESNLMKRFSLDNSCQM
jgi:hypothetical protein